MFEVLLKESPPNRERKFALVKLLLNEESSLPRERLENAITEFYKLNYDRRTSGQFRRTFAARPYPWLLNQFILTFRTAFVSETKVFKAASKFRHLLKNVLPVPNEISSVDVLHLVVHRLTKPRVDQLDTGIGLETFCRRWRDVSFFKFGSKYEKFFDDLDSAIIEADQLAESDGAFYETDENPEESFTDLEMTQTELDWFKELLAAFENNRRPPLYPLQRGPQTPVVLRLEKLVRAAHARYPQRHAPLEEAVARSCLHFLRLFTQEPKAHQRAEK
jgi:hypothetical protein